MTFVEPLWFFLLIAIPLVVAIQVLLWLSRSKAWKSLVAERLRKRLVRPRSGTRIFVALGLAMLGFALLVTSLAMPEAGEEWVETRAESRNILLCFDISQSMLTEDAGAGSRLDAAKAAALEIVERFPADRIGLLIFSGETQVTVPLTIDHTFLNQTINQLNPLDLPIGGSNLAMALNDAIGLLVETGQRNNIMVIFSDGEDHSSGIEAASSRAKTNGVFVYTLGFGSEKGDFIKDPRERDGFFLDRRGNRVVSQLKEASLQKIAERTEGVYARGVGGNFLGSLDAAVASMDVFQEAGGHQRIAKPVYQWFLLPSLLLLMSSVIVSRLGSAAKAVALFAAFLTLPSPVEADELTDAFFGKRANRMGDHQEAHGLFQDAAEAAKGERRAKFHLAAGASAIQAGQWGDAVSSFSNALISEQSETQREAHFALANALFYLGANDEEARAKSWDGAVSHLEESLKLGETKAARENLEALRKLLKKQDPQDQDKKDDEKPEDEKSEDEKSEDEKSEDEKPEDEKKDPKEDAEKEGNSGEEEKEKEEGEPGENEKPDEGKEGESDQEKQEQPGEEKSPEEGQNENQEEPREGEPSEKEAEEKQAAETQEDQKTPEEETPEERARRILNQQADFGARPPRSQRRVLRRPEKDW
ncbi:VWA domain-containing protein [Akkermansiaceae bacterium]|nr:VWA domain-containing protein [Akkermansiaceae bacterium]MDB4387826.1 VWA domain-containing protein [Akkermansiaceae bacterium]MDB4467128.1 VWA domain-containing protein [Akkermansiaceae bacterium]